MSGSLTLFFLSDRSSFMAELLLMLKISGHDRRRSFERG